MNVEAELDYHCEQAVRLMFHEDKPLEALSHVLTALDYVPQHLEALLLAGEIYVLSGEEMGIADADANQLALHYFDLALAQEPQFADAWSGKALALIYLERPQEALEAAENGFAVLPLRVGVGMACDEVYINVAEALFDCKVRSLLDLGKRDEARDALLVGLNNYPESAYLTRLIEDVSPHVESI